MGEEVFASLPPIQSRGMRKSITCKVKYVYCYSMKLIQIKTFEFQKAYWLGGAIEDLPVISNLPVKK